MKKTQKNIVYMDGANLYMGVSRQGWVLDYARFFIWLQEKKSAERVYIFLGYIPKYKSLYEHLEKIGYIPVFKDTVYSNDGKPKGNCDADLVLHVVVDVFRSVYDKAVIVSSDGDFASTIAFLMRENKLDSIVAPHVQHECSALLKRTGAKITFVADIRSLVEKRNEKAPDADGTAQGSLS